MVADMAIVTMRLTPVCLISLAGLPLPAMAHVAGADDNQAQQFWRWTFEPWVLACLGLAMLLYAIGTLQLAHRSGNRSALLRRSTCFVLGWLTLVAALVSPLDALGGKLFSAHMVQHELLMIVAAPLLVMSRPFGAWLWALPLGWRHAMGKVTRCQAVSVPWRFLSLPLTAWIIHALALWLWHIPIFFDAALLNDTVHTFQHLSFLITALFFWWALLDEHASAASSGIAMAYLFTTMLHTGALGALMTFSTTPWYTAYADSSFTFSLSAIEDQQLGGLIMWIPGGIAYLLAGLALGARWMGLEGRPTLGRR